MMKSTLLIPVILLLTAFQSQPGNSLIRIKEIDNLKTGSSVSYTYDEQGRILTSKSSKGHSLQYRYVSNLVIRQSYDGPNQGVQIDTLQLNSNGWADMGTSFFNGKSQSRNKCKFDENGFMVEEKQYRNDICIGTSINIILNGNKIAYTYLDEKKAVLSKVTYTYYPDKLNTIGDENAGMLFHGHDSKNLMKQSIALDEKGDTTSIVFYSYKFDSQGRVIQKVLRQKNGALQDSTGYIYY